MIYFKKLRWKNLLSTGNVFTEIDLCGKDTTLIIGQNGAGKSTILDALSFALFGKPFRKITKPQLINSITKKNCVVELEFSIGSNQYKIVRGMKPTIFEVYQNNSLLNQSAEMKDYQELLEKQIIKVNHKSFSQVIILGSATFQPFMQLSTSQRREIIEDLLDLQIFTVMNSLLKDKVLNNSENIYDINTQKKLVDSKIELTKQHMLDMKNNNYKLAAEKQLLIDDTVKQIKQTSDKVHRVSQEIIKLQQDIGDEESISKKMNKLSQLKHQIEAKVAILNEDVEFFNNHENCPTCKQHINEEFRNKTVEDKNNQIKETEEGLKLLSVEYDTANNRFKQIVNVMSEIQNLEIEKIEYKTTVKSLVEYSHQLEDEIKKLKDNKNEVTDNKINEYEEELRSLDLRYNQLCEEKDVLEIGRAHV